MIDVFCGNRVISIFFFLGKQNPKNPFKYRQIEIRLKRIEICEAGLAKNMFPGNKKWRTYE